MKKLFFAALIAGWAGSALAEDVSETFNIKSSDVHLSYETSLQRLNMAKEATGTPHTSLVVIHNVYATVRFANACIADRIENMYLRKKEYRDSRSQRRVDIKMYYIASDIQDCSDQDDPINKTYKVGRFTTEVSKNLIVRVVD